MIGVLYLLAELVVIFGSDIPVVEIRMFKLIADVSMFLQLVFRGFKGLLPKTTLCWTGQSQIQELAALEEMQRRFINRWWK